MSGGLLSSVNSPTTAALHSGVYEAKPANAELSAFTLDTITSSSRSKDGRSLTSKRAALMS